MGWSFDICPSSKKDYVKKILQDYKTSGYEVLGSRQTNQGLYVALISPKGHKFLMCGMIKKSEGCYGIKEMEEEMGPCMSDCPSSFFKFLDEPRNEYAREFRERCIANDKLVKARRKWKPQVDETVDIYGELYIILKTDYYGKNKYQVRSLTKGGTFSARKGQMKPIISLEAKNPIVSDTVADNCIIDF